MKPYLSVVVPSYNEEMNIERGVLEEMLKFLKTKEYTWELILSDDGSTDDTPKHLDTFAKKDKRIKVLHNIHAGKAPTVKSGMLTATGSWRLFTDFDQSTPLKEVDRLMKYASAGASVIIGSREMIGAKRDKEPFHRHLMGRVFNFLVQILAIPGILDTQCGFKLFSQNATEALYNQLYIYGENKERNDAFTGAFDVELLFLAKKNGFKIKEIPIEWKHNASDRVSPIKDSLRMLRDILFMRLASIRGKYN